jgi:hypothetical protein
MGAGGRPFACWANSGPLGDENGGRAVQVAHADVEMSQERCR